MGFKSSPNVRALGSPAVRLASKESRVAVVGQGTAQLGGKADAGKRSSSVGMHELAAR